MVIVSILLSQLSMESFSVPPAFGADGQADAVMGILRDCRSAIVYYSY